MATERRREIVLGAVLLVLVFVLYRAWASVGTSEPSSSSPDTRARSAKVAGDEAPQATAPDVRLESLEDDRPQPVESDRNLFRFKPVAPPPEPSTGRAAGAGRCCQAARTNRTASPPADSAEVHRHRRSSRAIEADRGARRFDGTVVRRQRRRGGCGAVSDFEDRRGIDRDGVSGRARPADDPTHDGTLELLIVD